MTDPIADMLTRIRNATVARHQRVDVPGSKLKIEIARTLQKEGYVQGFKVFESAQNNQIALTTIRIFLKYGPRGERVISGINRVSRDNVPTVLAGLGSNILTTSRGVMTGREAKEAGVGGEVLCNIW